MLSILLFFNRRRRQEGTLRRHPQHGAVRRVAEEIGRVRLPAGDPLKYRLAVQPWNDSTEMGVERGQVEIREGEARHIASVAASCWTNIILSGESCRPDIKPSPRSPLPVIVIIKHRSSSERPAFGRGQFTE